MDQAEAWGRDPDRVVVSPELTAVLRGQAMSAAPNAVSIAFDAPGEGPATLRIDTDADAPTAAPPALRLLVCPAALARLGVQTEHLAEHAFHLPSELRRVMLALLDCRLEGEVGFHYRSAKAVELTCEVVRLLCCDALTPLVAASGLSLEDSRRVLSARRLVDERWSEALTLEQIGRACGLNRVKLSRGFRSLFNCTVAEAIAERRLAEASALLRTTDLPVSLIAYRSGYQNNASFARAFGRRFGVPPTGYRSCALAA